MHELGPEPNFNESMYFNVYDPTPGRRRLLPLRQPRQRGQRRDDGLPLPARRSGRRSCSSGPRSTTTTRSTPAACGSRWSSPFEQLDVAYDGKVVMLDDPLADGRPEEGLHREPVRRVRGRARLHRRVATCSAASPTSRTRSPARSSPRATTSSSSPARARSASATRSGTIDGFGLRDHSWGPRYWQAPWYYRWLTANFGDDFGFMGSRRRPPRRRRHPRRLRVGGRPAPPLPTTSRSAPSGHGDDTLPPDDHGDAALRRARSGRSPARCST